MSLKTILYVVTVVVLVLAMGVVVAHSISADQASLRLVEDPGPSSDPNGMRLAHHAGLDPNGLRLAHHAGLDPNGLRLVLPVVC